MPTPTPSEKRKLIANLRTALGAAETAMEGADLPGLEAAGTELQTASNRAMGDWTWREGTERARLVRAADRLLPRMGDEIKRRRAEAAEDAQYAATKAAKVDPSDDLAIALTDAAVAVAHCTAEVVAMAEPDGKGGFTIDAEDMHQLRALLGAWRRAGEALMQHVREGAKSEAA